MSVIILNPRIEARVFPEPAPLTGVPFCPNCRGYYVEPSELVAIGSDFNGEGGIRFWSPFSLALWECITCGYVGPLQAVTS